MDAWGKFESSDCFHRLEHHCADVAACFEALLAEPVLRARFEQASGGGSLSDTTVARLTVLAFLHDFGKLNSGFQFKVRERRELPTGAPPKAGHLGEALLSPREILETLGLFDLYRAWGDAVEPLLLAALSHHGRPARKPTHSGSGPPEIWKPFAGYDPRATAALLRERTRAWFSEAFEEGPCVTRGLGVCASVCRSRRARRSDRVGRRSLSIGAGRRPSLYRPCPTTRDGHRQE